ncbi:MAG: MSMEG_1061 family FMN-dependent PPOX-type flavoprotein [bacterium]
MTWITTLDDLHAHYGTPSAPAVVKVTPHLTPSYRAFLDRSRFCVLTTVGPEGTDGSPRGDQGPVVSVIDPKTLALPDWKGNERIDSLRNIVRDGRVSLMFLVPGSTNALRINGTAKLTTDPALLLSFTRGEIHPRTVIVIQIAEVYSQCSRAIQRSELWTSGDLSAGIPSIGTMLQEASAGSIDGSRYDTERATRAHLGWW